MVYNMMFTIWCLTYVKSSVKFGAEFKKVINMLFENCKYCCGHSSNHIFKHGIGSVMFDIFWRA